MVPDTLKSLEPLWGVWRVERLLGEGASGKVYLLAREDEADFVSALKWIHIPKDPGEINQLHQEGHTDRQVKEYYSQLVHSLGEEIKLMHQLAGNTHVVNYLDHIILSNQEELGWDILIRMEYLTPLAAFSMASSLDSSDETIAIHTSHKNNRMSHMLTERDIIRLGCDICQALTLLEKRSIIHRDIKPENIFVSKDGDFKLGDFGISRTLEKTSYSLSVKGTPMYMAPETMLNQKADRSSDIYSLGIVMYRMLNRNRCPFLPRDGIVTSSMREEATGRRLRGESMPPPAYGSKELHRIVLKACAYHPQSRYRCAQEMEDDLKALKHESKGRKTAVKKKPWHGYTLAGLLCAVVLIFASANGWQWNNMVSVFRGGPANTGGVPCVTSPVPADTPTLQPSKTPKTAAAEAKTQTTAVRTVSVSMAVPTPEPAKTPAFTAMALHTPALTLKQTLTQKYANKIACAKLYQGFYGIKADGTILATGDNHFGQYNVSSWKGITAISAGAGFLVGLKTDGTVLAAGTNAQGQCNVSYWENITAVSAGYYHTVGLQSNGKVIATGMNTYGECDVSSWYDIIAISAGNGTTFGLKTDGTVIATGNNEAGQCNVDDWTNIVSISAGSGFTIGLKADGTVVAAGKNDLGQSAVSYWKNIVAVSTGDYYTIGLKSDGTVLITNREYEWHDVIAVAGGASPPFGLNVSGSVLYEYNGESRLVHKTDGNGNEWSYYWDPDEWKDYWNLLK